MAKLSPAKVLLLAVQLACKSDIPHLRTLLSQNRTRKETIYRILLTHLPETLNSTEYVSLVEEIVNESLPEQALTEFSINSSALDGLSEEEAKRRARKLRLLPLKSPSAPHNIPNDPLIHFLIHRSLRIDESTGLLTQIPPLLSPFIQHSDYVRTWLISRVLPLLRLNYEYHVGEVIIPTIPKFDSLNERDAVAILLSRTGHNDSGYTGQAIGRDLRGLVGPWMYGNMMGAKSRQHSAFDQTVVSLDETLERTDEYLGWEEVFKWLNERAMVSWETVVKVYEQWDGPGDVDFGGYENGASWVNEDDQQKLEVRYARSILASAYSISETSAGALSGVGRMLSRLVTLMDREKLPTLEQGAALLLPVPVLEGDLLSPGNSSFLRINLMEKINLLTTPSDTAVHLVHAFAISAFIFARAGLSLSIRAVGELVLLQDKTEQNAEFFKLVARISEYPKQDEKYWARTRNEILWLRNWGAEQQLGEKDARVGNGRGPLGRVPLEVLEKHILEVLLDNSHFTLAQELYENSSDSPLSKDILQETIISSSLKAFENATNANKTRGGVKKSVDIMGAFPNTLYKYPPAEHLKQLINITHTIGTYKLVFKQGEPFKPVQLLVHSDPIGIIGKILDQNPKSYSKIVDFIDIGDGMVRAGLLSKSASGYSALKALDPVAIEKGVSETQKRVVSMCIDTALSEDDFETAYSYVVTRLKDNAGPAHARSPGPVPTKNGIFPDMPPKIIDDWSWRAALQSGKYRRTANTLKPSHLGNTNANPDIRHLEQRMECLAQALRLAPKATLQEILNVYRRCEEELESLLKQEAEQEDAWDTQGDSVMPGGFEVAPIKKAVVVKTQARGSEEAPLSLFDLSRASVMRAQSGFASLATARNTQHKNEVQQQRPSAELSRTSTPDSTNAPMRKRDQLRNVAVGGLASGVGWILGAQPVRNSSDEER